MSEQSVSGKTVRRWQRQGLNFRDCTPGVCVGVSVGLGEGSKSKVKCFTAAPKEPGLRKTVKAQFPKLGRHERVRQRNVM